ncbi:hypothetical protein conserved [Leishmania donovani]|uniref:Uncharacterized protein n=3 Tax=Leishmania donovani species complex TaxID=38574 RepID=A4HTU7_LEIIN|nr:conserved hypothetical protein [Leishmania infantum JPCM5]XP_003858710.1 hypothetical protein, conserved [Leishmania donovani]CAC9453575.1 hypothetical_protein_-__conserved [Leishmania infantum]AYU76477.1 hypothetical protein LdCL_090008800 [Leishmania donovani]CAJ1986544.1 hypothetical protein conserved [Leishmania donovani]CAM65853.1 conserved hypothetical protein [Leishmania infantum JPCM5]CBZ31990.1 hypothetical protein, conserved [Leishmania donovani]|eukprot:XP_001463488.1 conserved hypothetical protein [Leishmania infantum JPCM5]
MVRVGAKRERPCILVLHVALRAAQQPAREGPQRGREGGTSLSTSPRERFIWKTSATAEVYAKAVLRSIRAYWQLLGGVRYAGSDALTLISAVWQDIDDAALGATAAAQAGGIVEGDSPSASPLASTITTGVKRSKQQQQRRRQRMRATRRRSGVLRCAVHLSRSVYGDAGAAHVLRASCACVTEATVEVPVSQLVADDGSATVAADASNDDRRKRRRRRTEEDVEDVMPQTCHAAVHVTRVENVLPSRQRR